ncbi:hypothetical protein SLS54_003559 [Diplodia seriata]
MAIEEGQATDSDLVRLWQDAIRDFKAKARGSKDWEALKTIIDTQKHRSWKAIQDDPQSWHNTFEAKRHETLLKNLTKEGDKELKTAFNEVKASIKQVESGLPYVTYAAVQDLTEQSNENFNLLYLSNQKKFTELMTSQLMSTSDIQRMRQILEKMYQGRQWNNATIGGQSNVKKATKDPAARRDLGIAALEDELSALDLTEYIRDQEEWLFAPACDWFHGREEYKEWRKEPECRVLWITGKHGCGKTFLALSTRKRLQSENAKVGYFFFREDREECQDLTSALSTMVVQIAQGDAGYRRRTQAELKKEGSPITNGQGSAGLWRRFFANQFKEATMEPVFLIFDGVDEASQETQEGLSNILAQITEGTTKVHVLITGRDALVSSQERSGTKIVNMSDSDLKKSYRSLCMERIGKSMRRLKKFSKVSKRKIAKVLSENADGTLQKVTRVQKLTKLGMLYVENMLCRLEAIGLEKPVLDAINTQLPKDIENVYERMLDDCHKGRNGDQSRALQDLFAWLTFAKRRLTLQEAAAISQVSLQDKNVHLVVEHEIVEKLSNLLEIVRSQDSATRKFDEETDNSEEDGHETDEPDDDLYLADDLKRPVQFQERSLREFFRNVPEGQQSYRQSPYKAHLTIFLMCARVLTQPQYAEKDAGAQLEAYASDFFTEHLIEIGPNGHGNTEVSTDDRIAVIEALADIMTNKNNVCSRLEKHAQRVFSKIVAPDGRDWRSIVRYWADIPYGSAQVHGLSKDAAQWVSNVQAEHGMEEMMIPLAKGHAENLLRVSNSWIAVEIYRFASDAFLLTNMSTEAMMIEAYDIKSKDAVDDVLRRLFSVVTVEDKGLVDRAIGFIHYRLQHGDVEILLKALNTCKKSIDKCSCCMVLAYICDDDNRYEESIRYAEQALGYLQQAEQEGVTASVLKRERKNVLVWIGETKAQLIKDDGDTELLEAVIDCLRQARNVAEDDTLDAELLYLLMQCVTKLNGIEKLPEELESWPETDQIAWLDGAFESQQQETLDMFKQGAILSGRADLIIYWYKKLCKARRTDPRTKAWAVYELIYTYQFTLNQRENAEYELNRFLRVANLPSIKDWFHAARLDKADIIYDKFRHSNTVKEKEEHLEEMKKLLQSDDSDESFGLSGSQALIQYARMVRVVGKPTEYLEVLKRIFDICVNALEDDIWDNDGSSFRLLAKALTCLPGMDHQAKIALSLQFSKVDSSLKELSTKEVLGPQKEKACSEHKVDSEVSTEAQQNSQGKISEALIELETVYRPDYSVDQTEARKEIPELIHTRDSVEGCAEQDESLHYSHWKLPTETSMGVERGGSLYYNDRKLPTETYMGAEEDKSLHYNHRNPFEESDLDTMEAPKSFAIDEIEQKWQRGTANAESRTKKDTSSHRKIHSQDNNTDLSAENKAVFQDVCSLEDMKRYQASGQEVSGNIQAQLASQALLQLRSNISEMLDSQYSALAQKFSPRIDIPTNLDESLRKSQYAYWNFTEDLCKAPIYCNGCFERFRKWEEQIWLCLICTDCDLCSKCLGRLREAGDGRPAGSWYYYCGKDHKYIRGPVEGWRGVKDGIIRFGDKSVAFKDWLQQVKTEWAEACARYLDADSFVHDIL